MDDTTIEAPRRSERIRLRAECKIRSIDASAAAAASPSPADRSEDIITQTKKRHAPTSTVDQPFPKRARSTRHFANGRTDYQVLKPERLTQENLSKFNSMSKRPRSVSFSADSASIKSVSTTSPDFAVSALRTGVLDPISSTRPQNFDAIIEQMNGIRRTASPLESEYRNYVKTVSKVSNEATMVVEVSARLLNRYDKDEDDGYSPAYNLLCTGYPKDTGFNNGLSPPQPDYVEGLEMQQFDPILIDQQIPGAVLVRGDPYSIALPHLAGEFKGRGRDLEEARLQCAYVGAGLLYGRNQALSYIGQSDPPGYSAIRTFATDGTHLNFYAHHSERLNNGTTKYHQTLLKSTNLTTSFDDFKQGQKEIKNIQDEARNMSYQLKNQIQSYRNQTVKETEFEDDVGYEINYTSATSISSGVGKGKKISNRSSSGRRGRGR